MESFSSIKGVRRIIMSPTKRYIDYYFRNGDKTKYFDISMITDEGSMSFSFIISCKKIATFKLKMRKYLKPCWRFAFLRLKNFELAFFQFHAFRQ